MHKNTSVTQRYSRIYVVKALVTIRQLEGWPVTSRFSLCCHACDVSTVLTWDHVTNKQYFADLARPRDNKRDHGNNIHFHVPSLHRPHHERCMSGSLLPEKQQRILPYRWLRQAYAKDNRDTLARSHLQPASLSTIKRHRCSFDKVPTV